MAYGSALVDTVQSSTAGTPPQFNDGNGTQVGTLCRAWVNFNGTTSPGTIRASFNVGSVTKNATGDYTINFSTAMPDANYAIVGTTNNQNTNGILVAVKSAAYNGALTNMSASAVQIVTNNMSSLYDMTMVSVSIFR